ncbi:MAG: uracil-DNA glycosylase [Actinobacteria bacterium]|nr:uracil-DNA glycosylase [Actinomycetota bacterium]
MSKIGKSQVIKQIREDIANCDFCRMLAGVGDIPVFPRGNLDAACMLVGEGPGEQEEKQQKPFVGAAGRLLEETLKNLGFDIEHDFYITNIVKYRSFNTLPSGRKANKPPTVKHINAERDFLEREIAIIKPKLIVALGAKASQWFLGKGFKLTQDHGKFYNWHGIEVLPTYHPAAILRARAAGNGGERVQDFKQDLQKIKEIINPPL